MTRWRYELRLLGWSILGLLPAVVVVFSGLTVLISVSSLQNGQSAAQSHDATARLLLELLEFGLPPMSGFAAAAIVTGDPARELQLSLPVSYPATMAHRLGLFILWAVLVCGLTSGAIMGAHYWIAPQGQPQGQLVWGAPILWFVAGGGLLALLLHSRATSSAVLGLLWMLEAFFHNEFLENPGLHRFYFFLTSETIPGGRAPAAAYWLDNRLALIAMAAVMFAAAGLLLRRNEALLGSEV